MRDDARELVSLHRLNGEPIIILGYTKTELLNTLMMTAPVCLFLSLSLLAALGRVRQGVPIGLLLTLMVIIAIGVLLARVKRQRPNGYYQQRMRLYLEDIGLGHTRFIRKAYLWDHRRH